MFKKLLPWFILTVFVLIVYKPFLFEGKLPIPADTIVGMYYPWYERIPVKNPLVTDAVRQQYPWRFLAINLLKRGQFPAWNPYSFSGYPLAANLQSAAFYPLNFIYWLTSFSLAWSWQVVSQTILGGIFMILFLKNLKLNPLAVALGTIAWVGSGFWISWLETNVVIQTALWLPLLLLAIDKNWWLVLVFGLTASFLAGHLQIFFYIFLVVIAYGRRKFLPIAICFLIFAALTFFAWKPALDFIFLSARNIDQSVWQKPDWFIPWQNLTQFLAPDYFGNPATGNYFGIWNYGEFIGYIGIIPLIFVFLGRNKFFISLLLVSLLFALPTGISALPFALKIPFISSAQPSRLIVLIDFSLAVLAAIGLDNFLRNRKIFLVWIIFPVIFIVLWIFAGDISRRNLILPTVILGLSAGLILSSLRQNFLIYFLIFLALFDSGRFAGKFLSFSSPKYLYPETKVTSFLQKNLENYRFASLDDRIMPANFAVMYQLQDIGGYDPLYLKNYSAVLSAANRMISLKDYKNPQLDILGVKYILSLTDINSSKFIKVFQEGETRIYENKNVKSRASFVNSKGKAVIEKYEQNEIIIKTESDTADSLVLTDIYYPTWKAEIDGKSVQIFSANNLFRQISIPAGKHLIRFFL